MDLILLGAPGAGKGTQGALLGAALSIPKIATGDILRDAVRRGTELGREAKKLMDAGELVPDTVILGLVRAALEEPTADGGAIFDGFPRNVAQAESLKTMLSGIGRSIDAVVNITVPEDTIVRRMSGRRTDPLTGVVYHVEHNPPPPEIADRVLQRDDDREETVRYRLEVYRTSTEPLVSFYKSEGLPVIDVEGDRPIDEVQRDILTHLER